MDVIITKNELFGMQNELVAGLTKGQFVKIVLNNGKYKDVCNKSFLRQLLLLIYLWAF